MSISSSENKYKDWVFTWNSDDQGKLPYLDDMVSFLDKEFELYVFQEEIGEETQRVHLQGAFRANVRVRQSTLLKRFQEYFVYIDCKFLTINRMCGSWQENIDYCTKLETRVGDNYFSSPSLKKYLGRDIKFLDDSTRQYPWQKDLIDKIFEKNTGIIKTPDDRKVLWYSDSNGNCGKSKFAKFLCFNNPTITKLSFGTAAQLRSAVVQAGPMSVYLIDIPRTLGSDDSLDSIISVIEDIKNGFVVSSMYGKHSVMMMDPPHVICFSNEKCPRHLMSVDRWEPYIISSTDKTAIGKSNVQNESQLYR